MNTKLLKQKILDLAIRGKLVPQDPNDEPASELLKRIRAEKEKLIAEGKIKRPRNTGDKPHYVNGNVPFEIPESWEWVRLQELCCFLSRGKSPKYSDSIKQYPVFAQKCNLFDGDISLENARFLDPQSLSQWDDNYKLRDGDVLINSTGTGTVCRTRIFHSDILGDYPFVVPDSHVSVVRTFNCIESYFVLYYITSSLTQSYLEDNLAGSTNQKELYINVIGDMCFPLPPQNEQKRIVVEIQKWFSLIDEIEISKGDLQNTIKQTKNKILEIAFKGQLVQQDPNDEPAGELLKRIAPHTKPCDTSHYENLPHNWCATTLECLCTSLASKNYQIKQSEIKESGKYPVISQSANYIEGYSDSDSKLYHITSPIIVFGDHTRIVKYIDFDFIVGADGVKILQPFIPQKYFYYLTQYVAEKIENRGYSRHYGYLSKYIIPLPPKEEQERIALRIEELFNILDTIYADL